MSEERFTERLVMWVAPSTAKEVRALATKQQRSVAGVLRLLVERALALNVSASRPPMEMTFKLGRTPKRRRS